MSATFYQFIRPIVASDVNFCVCFEFSGCVVDCCYFFGVSPPSRHNICHFLSFAISFCCANPSGASKYSYIYSGRDEGYVQLVVVLCMCRLCTDKSWILRSSTSVMWLILQEHATDNPVLRIHRPTGTVSTCQWIMYWKVMDSTQQYQAYVISTQENSTAVPVMKIHTPIWYWFYMQVGFIPGNHEFYT